MQSDSWTLSDYAKNRYFDSWSVPMLYRYTLFFFGIPAGTLLFLPGILSESGPMKWLLTILVWVVGLLFFYLDRTYQAIYKDSHSFKIRVFSIFGVMVIFQIIAFALSSNDWVKYAYGVFVLSALCIPNILWANYKFLVGIGWRTEDSRCLAPFTPGQKAAFIIMVVAFIITVATVLLAKGI